ncbi:deaminase [Candidatus Collierbacteria bacterium CG22_combo_CG10-13_8_21_14_all_43_12]|uniref:Deaminase n=1 Tax=Candidatus Collierbacteria bacterium CG22_combo_CG10-13_8_21_14_all_43_12 TaxID=1974537 RepID=A0A2H0DV43_9BACT|nr:MAG: deaminase [Candidatus Collierbacteria bacterium CG22_combo_CG10-13_8_21_14_all_43_12]
MDRTYNTLFLIQSLDGKISTGDSDYLDVDLDFKRIHGVKEGLSQYYDIEKNTDPFSLNSGKVMAKIGVNLRTIKPIKMGCSFIVIDNRPHLTESGVRYLSQWVRTLYLVTTNKTHPAYSLKDSLPNMQILDYEKQIDFTDLFRQMKHNYLAERVTIQSGGQLNAELLRNGLIDEVSIVIAPCLIGGKETQSLIGGESIHTEEDLKRIKPLVLKECRVLDNSYIHLRYQVTNITVIDPK